MATIGDVVLIYCEEKPAFFARIEDITADQKRDWYQVRLLVLHIPLTGVLPASPARKGGVKGSYTKMSVFLSGKPRPGGRGGFTSSSQR